MEFGRAQIDVEKSFSLSLMLSPSVSYTSPSTPASSPSGLASVIRGGNMRSIDASTTLVGVIASLGPLHVCCTGSDIVLSNLLISLALLLALPFRQSRCIKLRTPRLAPEK